MMRDSQIRSGGTRKRDSLKTRFSPRTEQRFFFYMTLFMLVMGLWARLV